ncbi:hypothetical protein [Clostridium algidicarnis]|uniref:hypothetical protein n=1 Tax=Clostridium algidicarnis TaxID=37659 RepID=UPI000496F4C0|nr:hypothetical protein [Clostridium algidicarnis]
MYKFIYFTIILIVIFIISLLLNKLRQKTTNELEKILYIQNDPKLYLELLKNPRLKILYKKSSLLQFQLDAYLLLGDDFKIENIIKLLDIMIMTKGETLEYNLKKLSYYCSQAKKDKAQVAFNKIEDILSKVKGHQAQFIHKESKIIFDIYIRHDTKLIKELEQLQANQEGIVRGLTLYRLAKLSYFDKNSKKTQSYLLQAKELLDNTVWFYIVEEALKDMSVLNYK